MEKNAPWPDRVRLAARERRGRLDAWMLSGAVALLAPVWWHCGVSLAGHGAVLGVLRWFR